MAGITVANLESLSEHELAKVRLELDKVLVARLEQAVALLSAPGLASTLGVLLNNEDIEPYRAVVGVMVDAAMFASGVFKIPADGGAAG